MIAAFGTFETPEINRQAREFGKLVAQAGKPVKLLIGENYNHFEMIETLASPYGLFGRAVLQQMEGAPSPDLKPEK